MLSCIWECLAQLCGNIQSSIPRKTARPFPDLEKMQKKKRAKKITRKFSSAKAEDPPWRCELWGCW